MRIAVWADRQIFANEMFADKPLDEIKKKQIQAVIDQAKLMLIAISNVPDGSSRDFAMQYLRLAIFFASSAIEGDGNY